MGIVPPLLVLIHFAGTLGAHGSTIVFRMSETQFNEDRTFRVVLYPQQRFNYSFKYYFVAKDMFRFSTEDQTSRHSNTLDSPDQLTVSIPRDGILRTTAVYGYFTVNGGVNLNLQGMSFFDYSTELQFRSCTLVSEGEVESIWSIHHENTTTVSFQTKGCVFTCSNVSIPQQFEETLKHYINTSQISENLKELVCQNYKVTYDLVLKSSCIDIPMTRVKVRMLDTSINIVNSEIMFLQEVTFSQYPVSIPEPELHNPRDRAENEDPFEMYMSSVMLDEAFAAGVEYVFNGYKTVTLSSLIPILSDKDIQSLGSYIPKLGRTFPNSTFDMLLTDITITTQISNNSFWIHGTLDGSVIATLVCNPNRTYTAFKFQIVMSAPIQLATDNKQVGIRLTTFKGNFTILETNIGRVGDRFLESVFYVLPQLNLISDMQSERLHGLNLHGALPSGFVINNTRVRIVKDYIVVGGHLTKDGVHQNVIPFENVTWIGDLGDTDNYFFPLIDHTPENATGMPIQNCTVPTQTKEISASTSTYRTHLAFVMCLCYCFLVKYSLDLLFV